MTSAGRSANRCKDPSKQAADNLKKCIVRELQAQEHPLKDEQIETRREADCIRRARSRSNQSLQKTVGLKAKDQSCNRAALQCDNFGETSMNRVCKHCDKIKLTFPYKKAKVNCVSQSFNRSLELLSPKSKIDALAQTCTSSMSP